MLIYAGITAQAAPLRASTDSLNTVRRRLPQPRWQPPKPYESPDSSVKGEHRE
jgi:hypothetical protein